MQLVKVQNEINLMKDLGSRAIVNVDTDGYQSYLNQRRNLEMNKNRVTECENQIRTLSYELTEIKCLLKQLVDNINTNY